MFSTNGTALHHLPVPLSHDAQILFLWLALSADETGHVAIHPGEMERAMDDSSEHLETALHELVAHGGLLLSQAGNHRSFHITSWPEWQAWLAHHLPTPSSVPSRRKTTVSYQTCLRPVRA